MEGGDTADAELRHLIRAVRGGVELAFGFGSGVFLAASLWAAAAGFAPVSADAAAGPRSPANASLLSFYPADPARGRALAVTCVACHGSQVAPPAGQPFPAPRLGGQRPEYLFDALLDYRSGARHSEIMASFVGALGIQELRDVSAYLAGPQIKPSAAKIPESDARERVKADCEACHGETGLGIMPGYPVIGGQYADYLAHALQAYRSGERTNPTMAVVARELSEREILELARFFEERGYLRSDN